MKACAVQTRGTASTEDSTNVPVTMEMKAGAPQAKKHVSTQQDQHHADDALQHWAKVSPKRRSNKTAAPAKINKVNEWPKPQTAPWAAVRRTDRVPVQSDDTAAT